MIAGPHPTLVTERNESRRAFEEFEQAFVADADPFKRVVGFQGGSLTVDVHWHETPAGIWGLFEKRPRDQLGKPLHRFWICFGVEDPNQQPRLSITVETNPPHEGDNRRTHGVFLRDELGRLYVGHTGRLGGRGFKQAEFRKFAQAQGFEWQEIATPKGLRDVVVFGPFQDPALLLDRLARYVHVVDQFKNKNGVASRANGP